MKVAVLNIGNELLKGSTLNTNLLSIGKSLFQIGNPPILQISVNDDEDSILSSLRYALDLCDTIIISGGLGPTTDDITLEVVAKYLNLSLVFNEVISKRIEETMKNNFSAIENKQALVPDGATVITNINGTAPGIYIEKNNKKFFLLPGPPIEMNPMLENFVIPNLIKDSSKKTFFKSVYSFGKVEAFIQKIVQKFSCTEDDVLVGYRVDQGGCETTFYGYNEEKIFDYCKKLRNELGSVALADGCTNVVADILNKLKSKEITLSIAESCSGGMLASKIVDIPGASDVFKGGIIAYDNSIKENILKVKCDTLTKYGAVSSQCAEEMLKGCSSMFNTAASIAITGIAGPTGERENKDIGLVYIATKIGDSISVKKYDIVGDRTKVRNRACAFALKDIRDMFLEI